MGKSKSDRVKNSRSGFVISEVPSSRRFNNSNSDIFEPGTLEARRRDFMSMSRDDRLMTFMLGDHSFCVQCGRDWHIKYSSTLHTDAYVCDYCGENLSIPGYNE